MDFVKKPHNTEEIFQLIGLTQIGSELLRDFNPKYRSGLIAIRFYPPEIVQRLRAIIGLDQPIGACFDTDGVQGAIYLDPDGVLGVLAPFLVHEIVHALDSTLWKAPSQSLSRAKKDRLILKAEKRAFDIQYQFMNELKARCPGYENFLKASFPKAKILHERLTEQGVAELYRLLN